MKTKKKPMTEAELDEMLIAQADDDSAWEAPIKVKRNKKSSVSLPSELAARALFFAKLHQEKNLDAWLNRIISERLDMEEAVFLSLKKDMGFSKDKRINP